MTHPGQIDPPRAGEIVPAGRDRHDWAQSLPMQPVSAALARVWHTTTVCEHHGEVIERGIGVTEDRVRWTGCPECARELGAAAASLAAEAERKAAEEARAERHAARIRERMGGACIPPRLMPCTFENFDADCDSGPAPRAAVTICRDYAEAFERRRAAGHGLLLIGGVGTGKSHLAAAIMAALVDRWRVQYMTVADLVGLVRDTWRRDSAVSEAEVMATLSRDVDLLVLDEFGVQSGSENERQILTNVMDLRYRNLLPTVCISNLGREEFDAVCGDRMASRLRETSRVVAFTWADYRPVARQRGVLR